MRRPAKFVATVAGIIVFSYWAVGRAADIEAQSAGGLSERGSTSEMQARTAAGPALYVGGGIGLPASRSESPSQPPVQLEQPGYRYQGKPALWWAKRAVQARKDANARGRTIRRLRAELARGYVPWYWFAVGSCESGLRWTYNGGSGFDGALQFHPGTWSSYRLPSYPRRAYLASPFQQLVVGELVLARQGWGAWPACSRKVGLR